MTEQEMWQEQADQYWNAWRHGHRLQEWRQMAAILTAAADQTDTADEWSGRKGYAVLVTRYTGKMIPDPEGMEPQPEVAGYGIVYTNYATQATTVFTVGLGEYGAAENFSRWLVNQEH